MSIKGRRILKGPEGLVKHLYKSATPEGGGMKTGKGTGGCRVRGYNFLTIQTDRRGCSVALGKIDLCI